MNKNLFADVRAAVVDALTTIVPDIASDIVSRVEVTPAKDTAHGDMATNVAMVTGKAAGRKPQEIATEIVAALSGSALIESAAAAGPGFVNLTLRPDVLRAQIPMILQAGEAYGDSAFGAGVRVNVEYVSANPTGPMHIGHCRGAVVGVQPVEEMR